MDKGEVGQGMKEWGMLRHGRSGEHAGRAFCKALDCSKLGLLDENFVIATKYSLLRSISLQETVCLNYRHVFLVRAPVQSGDR